MGRLPSPGVAWYRKKLEISGSDTGKCIFLDVDGAMSYAMVWLNGKLKEGEFSGWIIKQDDSTRPATSPMNWAKPYMPFPAVMDVISLNYQGKGIRQYPMFIGTDRIHTSPQYDAFHEKFPGKVILSSESASAASSRGIYLFPVTQDISSPIRENRGGNSIIQQVSSYELYAVDFESSADKVFGSIDKYPYVAGEFVWNGFGYLGEPTPYYEARNS